MENERRSALKIAPIAKIRKRGSTRLFVTIDYKTRRDKKKKKRKKEKE
jgi:hypothetical protein